MMMKRWLEKNVFFEIKTFQNGVIKMKSGESIYTVAILQYLNVVTWI